MSTTKRKRGIVFLVFLLISCVGIPLLLALINLFTPQRSSHADQITDLDVAYVVEVQKIQKELGDKIFPGFGTSNNPVMLFNEEYVFLLGMDDPADGWVKVPQEQPRGNTWQLQSPDADYPEMKIYRTTYDPQKAPDAFVVRVGETYVSSIATKEWLRLGLMNDIRRDLPGFLKPVFPYTIAAKLLVPNSDNYLSLIQHESFHAFQAVWADTRFKQAELDGIALEEKYPWENEAGIKAWETELSLLQQALSYGNENETRSLVQQFLQQRQDRRELMKLSPDLIRYETQREWVEGMARYVELESWRQASSETDFQSTLVSQSDPDFKAYNTFDKRWQQELDQMVRMANDVGDGRFYYSGMAQAFLLDRLYPNWKEKLAADPSLNLEDLLEQCVVD